MSDFMDIDVEAVLAKMAGEISALLKKRTISDPLMIGIHSGGVWLAERLHRRLNIREPLGTLDISFYRDDFTRIGMHPQVTPSHLPFNLDNRHIVLVDDVLYTGRTLRAALNEIFDYGRPASVMLAVLVDRGGRELPIEASVVGQRMELSSNEHIKLHGPEPLRLSLRKRD